MPIIHKIVSFGKKAVEGESEGRKEVCNSSGFVYNKTNSITPPKAKGETMRIGQGYDVHRLVEGRKLIIGGVEIPHEKGLDGHSDADVLVHAIMDALLGAAALGDIGVLFPDTDDAYKGADSMELLAEVREAIVEEGYAISNIDATIIAQAPKMRPYIDQMRENIARVLNLGQDQVNIKATTEEKLGFTGRKEGISAIAACLLE